MNKSIKAPGIIDGIIVAIAISLGAGATSLVLGGFVAYATLFNLLLCSATLIYLGYLLKRSNARVGRVVVIAGWAFVSVACWFSMYRCSNRYSSRPALSGWFARFISMHRC